MSLLVPTGKETVTGQLYYMPLGKDTFVHFTLKSRADEIVSSGKLMMRPPYKKFGADHVAAVSAVWGSYVPGVQTTHTKAPPGDELVAIVFKTSTAPRSVNYAEEVTWDRDVALQGARVVPASKGKSMLTRTPEQLPEPDGDGVTYERTASRVARRWASGEIDPMQLQVDPGTEVRQTGHKGSALHAARAFKKGEVLCPIGGQLVPAETKPNFQVGANAYISRSGRSPDAMNHSCEPNCAAMVEQPGRPIRTLRDIQPGEEVTIDYSVTSTDQRAGFVKCQCQSPGCRGKLGGGFHNVAAEQQQRYLALGIVPGYVTDAYLSGLLA